MSAHTLPATCRCLWCPRTFGSAVEASSHMHTAHRGNIPRTQEHDAAARLQHYHADRQAVRRGGIVADDSLDTPRGVGRALAERMRGIPDAAFLAKLDSILDHMREEMLAAGRVPSMALLICREIRMAARQAWAKEPRLTARRNLSVLPECS
ncbi:hypothetical protein [Roseomonas haemaphysalidis]|uniref:C2H2-type domain-containing protein n=1 Tax=Roseomonas haemaphysalidis TaxID=2768162 RepID=A0ABS3KWI7_9PROT|nr:hypothetical protein [Roseomonas haemaphysalidis]MBO1081837.1 hypothetical protein [Roseomonas haemaphysalidis]